MKVFTPEISWHERDPIYTCAFHPSIKNKFATSGVTGVIRLWEIKENECDESKSDKFTTGIGAHTGVEISFIANLKRHAKSVNVLRWNQDGKILASAGDETVIFLWNENEIKNQKTLDNDEDENKENWFNFKILRGHLEDILDISWSSDSSILISGSVDNSVIVWNVTLGTKLAILKEPKGFVQGVVFDPLGSTYAVLSTDRCLRLFSVSNNKCIHNVNKIQISKENNEHSPNIRIFHDDTMKSFFRRMCFSSDGNLLFTPAGCLELDEKIINTSYIFTRNSYNRPCLYIPHEKPSVAISVSPLKYELNEKNPTNKTETLFNLSYRYIFAIATEDSIYFYDTQNLVPFAYVTGIHYSNLSDISWSSDGRILIATSIDGFCTFVIFKENELGKVINEPILMETNSIVQNESSTQEQAKSLQSLKSQFFKKKESSDSLIDESKKSVSNENEIICIDNISENKKNTEDVTKISSIKKTNSNVKRIKLNPIK